MKPLNRHNSDNVRGSLRTGWVSWVVLNLAFLIVYFHRIAPSVVADRLMSTFGVSALALGILGSVYFYVYAAMQIPAGILADTLGPRAISTAGLLTMALGTGMFGLAPGFETVCLGRFLVGLGASVIFVSIAKIQSEWFSRRQFALLTGFTGFFGNAGVILGTAPLAFLVEYIDWRNSFLVIAVATFALAVMTWIVVRDRPDMEEASEKEDDKLVSANCKEIGHGEEMVGQTSPDGSRYKGNEGKGGRTGNGFSQIKAGVTHILSDGRTWLAFFSSFGIYGTFLAFTGTWGVPYFMNIYGLDRSQAATLSMIPAVGFIIGASFFGYVSDRMGSRKWPYRAMAAAGLAIWLIMALWNQAKPPLTGVRLLLFILGFSSPAFVLGVSYVKELNPPSLAGVASAIGNSGGFFGIAVMQPVLGLALDHRWAGLMVNGVKIYPVEAYRLVFLICAAVCGASFICTLLLQDVDESKLVGARRRGKT